MSTTIAFPSETVSALLRDHHFGHVIDGQAEADSGQSTYPVINPSTGEAIVDAPLGTAADVERAVAAARRALPAWRRYTPGQRAAVLHQLADLVDAHSDVFVELESLDVGKPLSVSRPEIPAASDVLRFMAGAIRSRHTPATDEYTTGYISMIRRGPVGVVAAITPWNYPFMTAVWKVAPALAAGNTMVLKPSEITPLSTLYFAELAREILPPGVLNVVCGDGPGVGQALSNHPDVDMISFTGSITGGVSVARAAADTLKHVHLELGGKAPVVIFDDADLDAAADTVRTMGYWNSGQECGAATRVLCASSLREAFVAKLRAAASTLKLGRPQDGDDVDLGPLVTEAHRERVDAAVQGAIRDGATVELGGGSPEGWAGYFYLPTILTNIPPEASIARTEVFGPVVTVETFETEEDAIRLANEPDYGLAASVWTENARRALRVVESLDYGTVWVNTHLVVASEMPWGGYGMSGFGRELSTYALDDFSRTKHVMIAK